eukprot:GHVR01064566.1.p3 GENE.GHVR01064566.1~~GHVR01064566.1.p3  ORF type:complete len:101 (+),score=6.83 GHVR01064566.1:211-513(+)
MLDFSIALFSVSCRNLLVARSWPVTPTVRGPEIAQHSMIEKLWGVATPLQHAAEQAVSERDLLFLGVARVCVLGTSLQNHCGRLKRSQPVAAHHGTRSGR